MKDNKHFCLIDNIPPIDQSVIFIVIQIKTKKQIEKNFQKHNNLQQTMQYYTYINK